MLHAILAVNLTIVVLEFSGGEPVLATEVRSPTTGVVIEVKVSIGDTVSIDDEMVVIESMKMHIPVTAPDAGEVQSLRVKEGDQINEDDLVATIG